MSYEAYKRNDIVREKTRDKKLNNQELIFGFTHKDSFLPKEINPKYNTFKFHKPNSSTK